MKKILILLSITLLSHGLYGAASSSADSFGDPNLGPFYGDGSRFGDGFESSSADAFGDLSDLSGGFGEDAFATAFLSADDIRKQIAQKEREIVRLQKEIQELKTQLQSLSFEDQPEFEVSDEEENPFE